VCPSRRSLLPANHSLFSVLLKLLSCPEGTAKSKPKAGEKYFTTAIFGHKVITKYSPSYTHTHTLPITLRELRGWSDCGDDKSL